MRVSLENAYLRPLFGGFKGSFSPNDVTLRPNPKKGPSWAETRHLSHKARISVARLELGIGARKMDSTVLKKRVMFHLFVEKTH